MKQNRIRLKSISNGLILKYSSKELPCNTSEITIVSGDDSLATEIYIYSKEDKFTYCLNTVLWSVCYEQYCSRSQIRT